MAVAGELFESCGTTIGVVEVPPLSKEDRAIKETVAVVGNKFLPLTVIFDSLTIALLLPERVMISVAFVPG